MHTVVGLYSVPLQPYACSSSPDLFERKPMQEITVANPQVFIPSRGRPNGARKLTQAWHEEGFDVNWVVERREHDDYFDKIVGYAPISGPPDSNPPKTHIHILPVSNA